MKAFVRAAIALAVWCVPALGQATGVVSVTMTVSDLERSKAFYHDVLAFEVIDEREAAGDEVERLTGVFGSRVRFARLRLGAETIELEEFLAPQGRPIPADSRSNDRWFQHIAIAVSDLDEAYRVLREHHVRHASSGPQTLPAWNPSAGGIGAFYFKDPDGHVLEIIHFPTGKGDPRWQHAEAGRLFLGIDHTAIVVADTERSLAFYRDTLGLKVAGGSENSGTEQEHLNNVFGARLRITALRAPAGPGVELLEYLAPTTGRDYPADSSVNDLWHWHTSIAMADLGAARAAVRAARAPWVSAGGPGAAPSGPAQPVIVRDPDGHGVLLCRAEGGSGSVAGPSRSP